MDAKKEEAYPLISVVVRVYNQESFIKQTLHHILMQQYKGAIEVIVSNDHSSDDTDSIIRQVIKEHPCGSWIRYTEHAENKGMVENFIWALKQSKGCYVAPCDGDDFWSDPLKIQKQVVYMQAHPEVTLSGHAFVKDYNDGREKVIKRVRDTPSTCTLVEHLMGNGFRLWTHTMMFRAEMLTKFPDWFHGAPFIDYPLNLICGLYGKLGYMPEVMAVYNREFSSDSWSSRHENFDGVLKHFNEKSLIFSYFDKQTNFKYHKALEASKRRTAIRYISALQKQNAPRTIQFKLIKPFMGYFLRPTKQNLLLWLKFLKLL